MDSAKEKTDRPTGARGGLKALTLLPYDVVAFAVGFLLTRCSVPFGAHPFGVALVSALPSRVWVALGGVALGALTLGGEGIIYGVIAIISVFLRIAVAGGVGEGRRLFSESTLLRCCTATLGGFVAAVYGVLLNEFSLISVFSGLCMVLIPPICAFAVCCFFGSGFDPLGVIRDGLPLDVLESRKKIDVLTFQASALFLCFVVGLSLHEFTLFGISADYVFSAVSSLVVGRRFGGLRGGAVGFCSLVGVSPTHAVSYALAGISSGLLSGVGALYPLAFGGTVLAVWSGYTEGLTGVLSTFPEFAVGAGLAFPLMKKLTSSALLTQDTDGERSASDMVGTMALSYRNRYSGALDRLEEGLTALSSVVRKFGEVGAEITDEELRYLIGESADKFCKTCQGYRACLSVGRHGCIRRVGELSKKLASGEYLTADDINTDSDVCFMAAGIAAEINRAAAELEAQRCKQRMTDFTADEYILIAKMINEARSADDAERACDAGLSEKLKAVFFDSGFEGGEIRAFGNRRKHIIAAGIDEDGKKITSDQLHRSIEECAGIRLGTPEYYRRGRVALMECTARNVCRASCAVAELPGGEEEVSGDTALHFESADGVAYTVISDGMGSGKEAKEVSDFSVRFLRGILDFGGSKETALHILNHLLRARTEERSATVDLFEIDLLTMEAVFTKCGAVTSYVKRDSSIFRIRSRTAPIGLMKNIDAERIKVEIKPGDYVIMLSDGVAESPEDATWLLELLTKPAPKSLSEYSELILSAAVNNTSKKSDDMTVAVTRIDAV